MRNGLKLLLCCAVMFSAASAAMGAGAVLVINTDGTYQVMVDGTSGKSVLLDVTHVVDKRGGTPPPGGNPPPPTTDSISEQVRAWSAAVNDPATAQGLALVYGTVGKNAAGQSRDKVTAALKQATDDWLSARQATAQWKDWRANVSKLIDAEEAKGPIDWPKFCASVQAGLSQSAPQEAAIPPELMALLIKLIEFAIKFFLSGGIGGGGGGV